MSEPFTNEPIVVGDLPRLRDDEFVGVDPRYILGQLVGLGSGAVVVAAIAGVIARQSGDALWPAIVGGGIVALLVAIAIAVTLEARRIAYQLREHDVSLRRGVLRHRTETIPFSRIQHVSVGRGLLERWLGLATLEVSSAGPDIAVPGLSVLDAERIKQTVAQRADIDTDDDRPAGQGHRWLPPAP